MGVTLAPPETLAQDPTRFDFWDPKREARHAVLAMGGADEVMVVNFPDLEFFYF
jgi:hypothetical protein